MFARAMTTPASVPSTAVIAGRTFPLVVADIGDGACKKKYRCGETPACGLFPRAQESGNSSQENKVPAQRCLSMAKPNAYTVLSYVAT
jgi:hypothetical protein